MACHISVTISWTEEEGGQDRYMVGKCVEISAKGLRIELLQPIPYLTYVTLRIQGMHLATSARVRHSWTRGLKAIVGLELSQPIRDQIIEALVTGKKLQSSRRWQN